MPFGELQRGDPPGDGVECGLREVPWSGQPACCASDEGQYCESQSAGLCAGQRYVYSVPQPGASADESDCGKVLRLAGGLCAGGTACRLLEAGGVEAGDDQLFSICGPDGAQEQ